MASLPSISCSLFVLALLAFSPLCSNAALNALGTLGTEHGGSCGYTANFPPKGTFLTGLSEAIYAQGAVCGGCYAVSCQGSKQCKPGQVVVTATNECMAKNTTDPCVNPQSALNLQPIAFDQISNSRAPGIVGITYTQVPCVVAGGVQFQITTGNNDYLAILIQNVGGPGALSAVSIKAGAGLLTPMTRSYGAVWEVRGAKVVGVPLSFVLTGWDGNKLLVSNAIPAQWLPQTLYTAKTNFNLKPAKKAAKPAP